MLYLFWAGTQWGPCVTLCRSCSAVCRILSKIGMVLRHGPTAQQERALDGVYWWNCYKCHIVVCHTDRPQQKCGSLWSSLGASISRENWFDLQGTASAPGTSGKQTDSQPRAKPRSAPTICGCTVACSVLMVLLIVFLALFYCIWQYFPSLYP